jgi:phosphatidylserine/phosphatidylglycerophosphate/cardiolipin synthase-like enzyme
MKTYKGVPLKRYFLLLLLLMCLGCQSRVVRKAAKTIERDASLTCPPETANRCAIPLDIGEDALLARIHLVRAARESIDIQTFIWDDDEVGQVMFMELLEAARRGVKVRMILDQFGTYVSIGVMAQMATVHENIDIVFFRPVEY